MADASPTPDATRNYADGMCAPAVLGDDTLYSSDEVAELFRCSPRTLAEWRQTGKGPRFVRHGRNYVFYRLGDIRSFIRAGLSPQAGNAGGRA